MTINIWKVSTIALAGALAFVGLTSGNTATADQPHMTEALATLQTAKGQLEAADDDKGGHRAAAIKLVISAIGETKAGIDYAATHKDHRSVDSNEAVPESADSNTSPQH